MTREQAASLPCFTELVLTKPLFVYPKGMLVRFVELVGWSDLLIAVETGGRLPIMPLDSLEIAPPRNQEDRSDV